VPLEKGAKVNAPTTDGFTPLHRAAANGHRAVVTLLLKSGADKKAKTKEGERPVDLARQQHHTTLIPLLEP